MDGISAVAGVAIAGVQLSNFLYDLYSKVRTGREEIQDVANNVSLLAMVLEELDGVLCDDDEVHYRPQLREAAQSITLRCASIFKDIQKHTGTDRDLKGEKIYERVAWYFKRERVKPLRSSLESLKSTLNILLHVVQLAKNTNGVKEYPGVKSIGHWYIRRERRGLVYLVIDNRHAVEKLKQMEQQKAQVDEKMIENERPLAFADIFPLSTTARKRDQSPERKFVVAFRSTGHRSDDVARRSQEPDEVEFMLAIPSTTPRDRDLLLSPSGESKTPLDPITGSDAESIGRSTSSQSAGKKRLRARPTDEQSTSQLILDIIPHEIADEALKSAHNMSRSTMLEAKAEETIDLLMRHWTYLDPEYFSDDERSSVSPSEHSVSLLQNRNHQHSHEGKSPSSAKNCSRSLEGSRRQSPDEWGNAGPATELDDSQSVSLEEHLDTSSSLPAGRKMKSRESRNPLSPTAENVRGGREAKARIISHKVSDQALQTPKEPSTPAPPYPSSQSGQCPSCSAATFSESKACADKPPCQPTGASIADVGSGLGTDSSMEIAIKLFETRFLEIMRQKSSPNAALDAQSHLVTEQQDTSQRSVTIEQEAEPVILKDCLGRKFLFPIQKCKSWQSMENLIKCSFSHVESMNSKIFRGSYDVLSPTGEIILPEIWDSVIKPGWVVELRLWDSLIPKETIRKDAEIGVDEIAPAVQSSTAASRQSLVVSSSDAPSATAKRRASLRNWLGGRKSNPSVAFG